VNRWSRIWKHMWRDARDVRRVLPPDAVARLEERVRDSEHRHSGEIRLCIEAALPLSYLWRDASPRERALALFGKLRVWDTEHNNGVLIYLLIAEHAVEIVDDRGLDRHVPDVEWQRIVQSMTAEFGAGRFEQGLRVAIDAVDALLVRHFPLGPGETNPNELPDAPHVLG
jgi:uncharacterized membrane protein YgcG